MAYDARAVANFFLELAKRDNVPVSPMKLQKILYFAHGWFLALTGKPLLEERIEAWSYGPVIPDIYLEFKRFGNDPVTAPATPFARDKEDPPKPYQMPNGEEDRSARLILEKVWESYKGFSAIALSNMTHQKETPWSKTVEPYSGVEKIPINLVISDELIKDYFTRDEQS